MSIEDQRRVNRPGIHSVDWDAVYPFSSSHPVPILRRPLRPPTLTPTRLTVTEPTRRFSLLEITSGLPDDSREADELEEERRLRDLRGRGKHARAVVAHTPGLAEVLSKDWRNVARFYARFGMTETMFRRGVPGDSPEIESPVSNRDPLCRSRPMVELRQGRQEARFTCVASIGPGSRPVVP